MGQTAALPHELNMLPVKSMTAAQLVLPKETDEAE